MGIRQFKEMPVSFQDEGEGVVKDETEDSIYIVSAFFTGWMAKSEFWEMWGAEDDDSDFDFIPA